MSEIDRVKWNERYQLQEKVNLQPAPFLSEVAELLPRTGKALDVAGGTGRNSLWLAERGLEVTLADISSQGLLLARQEAERAGVVLQTLELDLELEPFPTGPWDLIIGCYFLHRPLFAAFPQALSPGGLLAYCQPTQTNLERNSKPPAAFLLEDNELPTLVSDLEILHYNEGWGHEGRYEATIVARKT